MTGRSGRSRLGSAFFGALGWCLVAGCSGRADHGTNGDPGTPEVPRNGWDTLFRSFPCKACQVVAVAARAGGGFVVLGSFDTSLELEGTTLSGPGWSSFVAAFDGDGHVVWSQELAQDAAGSATPIAFATGPDGSAYVALLRQPSCSPLLTCTNSARLVKIDSQGRTAWTKDFQPTPVNTTGVQIIVGGLAVDRDRSVVIAGLFAGTIDFGSGSMTTTYPDAFSARFDENGQNAWSRHYGATYFPRVQSISISDAGQIAVAGVGSIDGPGYGYPEPWFVLMTDGQGQRIWTRTSQGQPLYHLYVSWAGDGVVVGGGFGTTLDIGLGPSMPAGPTDVFVAKFDANGAPSYATRFGSDDQNILGSLSIDAQRRTLVSGSTQGALHPMNVAGTNLGASQPETFIGMFDERGAPVWAKGILRGDQRSEKAPLASTIDETGAIYFAGTSDPPSAIYVGKLVP